ncbi:hypothetical protein WJX75_002376 [Coccomyxa subellipsoidea]|uniref:U-box domain-containing protein n=1 Tax=Coccomyxa subellipsoidea TaxID=248742 RepID=A0ABR2YHL3_9CHLO
MAETNLAQLFSDGLSKIQTKRCDNLFKDLDSRDLTEAEESIIAQRVALQQKMLEEYEKREKARKVREILNVCPDLTEEEADCALRLHSYKEEDAAAALTSGIAFRRKVQALCGTTRPLPSLSGPQARLPMPQCQGRTRLTAVGPVGARPAGEFLKHIGDGVFVGTFRGKGWELYKTRPLPRPKSPPATPVSNALPGALQKKRGRPPKARELTPPRPRLAKRRALGAANTDPPLSPPTAARRRRNGRLQSSEAASSLQNLGASVPEDADLQEGQEGPKKASAEPDSGAAVTLDQAKIGMAELGSDGGDGADEELPTEEAHVPATGALKEIDGSPRNDIKENQHQSEQCIDEGPSTTMAASPNVPAASPKAAVPRRQRGGRRFRRGTPVLPWTEPSAPASPEDEAAHAETDLPALEDHQVVEVSSGDAPQAKRSTRTRASESNDSQPQMQAEETRPKRQRRASAKATEALLNITLAADMQTWGYEHNPTRAAPSKGQKKMFAGQQQSPRRSPRAHAAASSPHATAAGPVSAPLVNKPRLGRVKRCSSKQVELMCIGELRLAAGWHNNGYIFPDGFCTRTVFRSSVELDQLCMHTCSILGQEGPHWPAPTFRIVAADRPDEVLDAKSPTGAWNAVLSRINSEIEARRSAGEDLPPPPKTAIAGPEYFGLTHPELLEQIEALDPNGMCTAYWAGKEDRLAYGQVHGIAPDRKGTQGSMAAALPRLFPAPSGGAARRRRRGGWGADGDGDGVDDAQDNEEVYAGNRWSGVDRAERARRRAGDDSSGGAIDVDNPLPHVIDPITLEPVVTPAMSPAGHVMGLATWTAVLAEQGKCPFTQQPLRRDQITVLTKSNVDRFRDRLKLP